MNHRNNKEITKHNKKQKKKHDKILIFSKSKLNSIKSLVSQALIDMEKGHEESIKILKKKGKYEIKENLRHVNENLEERTEKTRLNGVNSRT